MPRLKDEHKTEMIIRGLLTQPENRRCINCSSLGPQYVCKTFWTFICTTCSGVHREFSHRVKSVSMAKFGEEELTALQAGGNERAREIYFKAWDPQHNTLPDNNNLHRLREFIKLVYIDRRYAGQNNSNRLPIFPADLRNGSNRGGRNDFLKRLSFDKTSREGEPSPMKRDKEMDFRNIFEGRSPRNTPENLRSGSNRSRSTIHFEIVDNRFRNNGSMKRYESRSSREPRSGSSSPGGSQRGSRETNLPAIRSVKDILGEKPPELKVGEPPKANDSKDAEASARAQKIADGAPPGPPSTKQEKDKTVSSSSLIDFDAASEQTRNTADSQAEVTDGKYDDESSFVAPSTTHTTANASNMNLLESLLLDWSDPAPSFSETSQNPAGEVAAQPNSADAINFGTTKVPQVSSSPKALADTVTKDDQQLHSNRKYPSMEMSQVHQQLPEQQHHDFVSPAGNNNSNPPQSAASVEASNNMQLNNSCTSNDQGPVRSAPPEQPSQVVISNDGSTKDGWKPTGRKELPQDLFTSNFNAFSPVGGWQMHPPHATGYGMQFRPPAMPVTAFATPSKPRNPFDIGDDNFQVPSATFSSVSSLQGALPNMPVSAASGSHPSPYGLAFNYHMSQHGMNMPRVPGAYMGQPPNSTLHARPQGNPNFGRSVDAFASLNPIQTNETDSFPSAPNPSLSQGRNPFG